MHVGVVSTDRPWDNVGGCRNVGDLVSRSDGLDCGPYAVDRAYMTGQDDIETAFPCAANLGADGSAWELVIDAMLRALDPWANRVGGCNEGFHRFDLMAGDLAATRPPLVIVLITDEDDTDSLGDPEEWASYLRFLRGGTLDDTTVIALLDSTPEVACGSEPLRLFDFLDLLPTTFVGDVCGDDYSRLLADSVDLIVRGCDGVYLPEG
jgi:hypothetical protein